MKITATIVLLMRKGVFMAIEFRWYINDAGNLHGLFLLKPFYMMFTKRYRIFVFLIRIKKAFRRRLLLPLMYSLFYYGFCDFSSIIAKNHVVKAI